MTGEQSVTIHHPRRLLRETCHLRELCPQVTFKYFTRSGSTTRSPCKSCEGERQRLSRTCPGRRAPPGRASFGESEPPPCPASVSPSALEWSAVEPTPGAPSTRLYQDFLGCRQLCRSPRPGGPHRGGDPAGAGPQRPALTWLTLQRHH